MKIECVELRDVQTPLQYSFETSFGVERDLRKVILILRSDALEGYGEGTANFFPGYCAETTGTIWQSLAEHILPRVLGKSYETASQLLDDLRMILAGREPFYSKAEFQVDTSARPLQGAFEELRDVARAALEKTALGKSQA